MERTTEVIQTPLGAVEYSVVGVGQPVLMLHGSLENCNDSMGYEPLVNAGFRLITPSRPGYGSTPAVSGPSAQAAADLMSALLDQLGITSCDVVAASYGGLTALQFAVRHPQRVRRLVLGSAVTAPIVDGERLEQAKKFYGKGHKNFWRMLQFIGRLSMRALVKQTYVLFSTCDPKEIMKEITPKDIEAIHRFYFKKPENAGALLDLDHTITDDELSGIAAPTLIIHSRQDKAVPYSNAEYVHGAITGSELFTANTWGHFIWIGKGSDEVMDKMVAFLK